MNTEEILKEFDARFRSPIMGTKIDFNSPGNYTEGNTEEIKQFIRKQFKESNKRQWKEWALECLPETMDEGNKRTEQPMTENEFAFISGFNTAIQETKKRIEEYENMHL